MKKDLISLAELSGDEIWEVLNLSQGLEEEWQLVDCEPSSG